MDVAEIIVGVVNLSKALREVQMITRQARDEGRDISPSELEHIHFKYNVSSDRLDEAIKFAETRPEQG